MKKSWLYFSFALVASLVVIVSCWHKSEPEYVDAANTRIGSYLGYSFGPTDCSSSHNQSVNWVLECKDANGKYDFKYSIYPSEDEPQGFYAVAINGDAKRSAEVDLMAYLDIRIEQNAG